MFLILKEKVAAKNSVLEYTHHIKYNMVYYYIYIYIYINMYTPYNK